MSGLLVACLDVIALKLLLRLQARSACRQRFTAHMHPGDE
jgi:hypothetical protein